jgi:hypothetical protein
MKKSYLVLVCLAVMLALVFYTPAAAQTSQAGPPQAMISASPPAAEQARPILAISFKATPEALIAIAAAVLAILFDWMPKLKDWYNEFGEGQKRGIMSVLLLLITGAIFGLNCAGWLQTGWICSSAGILDAVVLLIYAIAVNQGVHKLTKP